MSQLFPQKAIILGNFLMKITTLQYQDSYFLGLSWYMQVWDISLIRKIEQFSYYKITVPHKWEESVEFTTGTHIKIITHM